MQQADGQPRQYQPRTCADGKQAQCRTLQAGPGAIQKDHGFAAFAADREHGQEHQANAALASQLAVGLALQISLEAACVAVHPADHLHHQQAGHQRQGSLEPFVGGTAHGVTGEQNQQCQQAREHQPQEHTRP
ncbi:hypothetical protein D3C71_1673720 [compost metagenome]